MDRPATTLETRTVYAAGVVQGITLVTFPAAGPIFTSESEYALSSTAYGAMFLPQAVTAIGSALLGAALSQRIGARRLYLVGLVANLAAMSLLFVSKFFIDDAGLAYALVLLATTSLGVGFGLTVPALSTLTAAFHPTKIDSSILVLNTLLGLGTALAPVFVAIFVGLGFWWGLPVMSGVLLTVLLVVSVRLPLRAVPSPASSANADSASAGSAAVDSDRTGAPVPRRFWVFAAFALLYGFCETMNGNWAQLDMVDDLGASATLASIGLTTFWAAVTLGRLLFALVQRWFPTRNTFRLLPFVLAVSFVLIALLPDGAPALSIAAFGIAGLGCSALLPLTVSFGQEELVAISASVAGGVIAFYQLGYGVAAFGVGPIRDAGVSLPSLFGLAGIVAAAMGMLSFVVVRRRPEPVSFHARPPERLLVVDQPTTQGAAT